MDSYHTVWMQLHQELILMLGLTRADDEAREERLVSGRVNQHRWPVSAQHTGRGVSPHDYRREVAEREAELPALREAIRILSTAQAASRRRAVDSTPGLATTSRRGGCSARTWAWPAWASPRTSAVPAVAWPN